MSLYASYLRERTNDEIIENDYGFASYRFLDGNKVYIIDIYISPEMRKAGAASALADSIVEMAKNRGCVELIGSVVPSAKNSADSMRVLLAYGMTPYGIEGNMVLFKKDI